MVSFCYLGSKKKTPEEQVAGTGEEGGCLRHLCGARGLYMQLPLGMTEIPLFTSASQTGTVLAPGGTWNLHEIFAAKDGS